MAKKKEYECRPETKKIIESLPIVSVGGTNCRRMVVKFTMTDDFLATNPNNEDIFINYVASKYPAGVVDDDTVEKRRDALYRAYVELSREPKYKKLLDDGITVFGRDEKGNLVIFKNMLYGFFKSAAGAFKDVSGSVADGIYAYKEKINKEIFVKPDLIRLYGFDKERDLTYCQRPLRKPEKGGEESTALSCSEQLPAGTYFVCIIDCMTDQLADLTFEVLNYGYLHGLGQWRNSGKGSFYWELLDEKGNVIYGNKDACIKEDIDDEDLCSRLAEGFAAEGLAAD